MRVESAFWLGVYVLLFVVLQMGWEYHFYFVEQNQLFLNDWAYVAERLWQPGGAALTASDFLVQFFALPFAGAALTAALLVAAGCLAHLACRRVAPAGAETRMACLLPVVALLFAHLDFNYLACGTVAFLLAEAAFCLVLRIKPFGGRLAGHLLAAPLLFFLAGPVSLLYAVSACVYEWLNRSKRSPLVGLVLCEALLISFLSVRFALYGEYRHAFLPDAYYHPNLAAPGVIYLAWCAFPAVLALACLLRGRKWVVQGVQAALVAVLCLWGMSTYAGRESARMKELDYYCRTEQWEKILERCQGTLDNYLYICYTNLALAQRGELGDRMFAYDQRGVQGLVVNWNKSPAVSALLSEVYFAMNEIAPAQKMAFEANVSATGEGNPRMLKRLVQTNLIYGAYPVAEKYIDLLDRTFAYRSWAQAHRRFLADDEAVEADPLLGGKRRALTSSRALSLTEGLEVELQRIAEANPSDTSPIHYAGAFYLLSKDVERFRALVERYFGTPVLPVLPVAFQEAVIILSEKDPAYWRRFRISEAVVRRFADFRQQALSSARNASLMQPAFGDSYWFYFLFSN